MKSSLFLAVILLAMTGCATDSKALDPNVQKLQWLDAADPLADAQQAVKTGDLRLLGMATRSINIPGVDADQVMKYDEKCGYQLIDGFTDVVSSDEHLRLMQKARSYALKYNSIIMTYCKI
ncbi:MAG: hypothetical protein ACJAZT_001263 [Gammaproteobacteria bacterium]|jgi:hypothetical protein